MKVMNVPLRYNERPAAAEEPAVELLHRVKGRVDETGGLDVILSPESEFLHAAVRNLIRTGEISVTLQTERVLESTYATAGA